MPPTYSVFRKDRNRHGGGVAIAFKKGLPIIHRLDLDSHCEIIWCEVVLKNRDSIFIGVFYRPPNSGVDIIDELSRSLTLLNKSGIKYRNIILTGDFNMPKLKWVDGHPVPSDNSELSQHMISLIECNFLFQHVTEPTRISESCSNILDLLFSSEPNIISSVYIIPGISDHNAVIFKCACGLQQMYSAKRKVY